MRTPVALALLCAASALQAQTQPAASDTTEQAAIPTQRVARAKNLVTPREFVEFRGQYSMDNGQTLSISSHNRRYFAQFDGQPEMEILAVAADKFVSTDGRTRMAFQQSPNGSVSGLTATIDTSTVVAWVGR
ncbi:hypothetical protein H3H37_24560 [Duganella sp. LX20W]|uniref:Peptidase S12 Pab87-related C-terminal domain-containing protein n=1 Tax=Rugamonas brunnea TaxID=2758569 RepID=A0A7W2IEN0_9BURK|nr:hypothetical protein [Rugamonas brunnea]MBA5640242.1 hypothetical protein [Rugamonas brunnea]